MHPLRNPDLSLGLGLNPDQGLSLSLDLGTRPNLGLIPGMEMNLQVRMCLSRGPSLLRGRA